jgi:hypothetical protein
VIEVAGGAQESEASSSFTPCPENQAAAKDHSSPLQQTLPTQGDPLNTAGKMVSFTIDPFPYIPPSMFLEDGGPHRQARHHVFISGGSCKDHEDCAIAVCNEALTMDQLHQLMHDINQYIMQEVQQQVWFFVLEPHGVGIFRL